MGNAPRTNNPYAVGNPDAGGTGLSSPGGFFGTQPPANPANDAYGMMMKEAAPTRQGMAQLIAAKPAPSAASATRSIAPGAPAATTPTVAPAATTPTVAPKATTPAAAPKATTPAAVPKATTPAVTTPTVTTPAATTPAVTTPAARPAMTPVTASPVATPVYTPPKATTPVKTTTPAKVPQVEMTPHNLWGNPGSPWTAAQIKAGGRWEIPAGSKGIGRNWVKYTAPVIPKVVPPVDPTPVDPTQVNPVLRDVLSHVIATTSPAGAFNSSSNNGMSYIPTTITMRDPKTGQPYLNPNGTPMTTQIRSSVLQGGSSHGGGEGGGEHA